MRRVRLHTEFLGGIERRVGWFALLGAFLAFATIIALSVRSEIFAKKLLLVLRPPSAAGFYEGQPVRLQGFRVGWVDALGLDEQGAWVHLKVLARYQPMLKEPLKARLAKEGVIGEQFVELLPGKGPAVAEDEEVLAFEPQTTLEEILKQLRPVLDTAKQLLDDVAGIAHWLNDPKGPVKRTAGKLAEASQALSEEQMRATLTALEKATAHLQRLLAEAEKQHLAGEAAGALAEVRKTTAGIRPLAEGLGKRGEKIAADVEKLLDSLDATLAGLAKAAPHYPGIARETEATLAEMRKLARDLRHSWLVGGGGKESPPVITPGVGE